MPRIQGETAAPVEPRKPALDLSCLPSGPNVKEIEGRLREGGWRGGFQDLRQLLIHCSTHDNAGEFFESVLVMLDRAATDVSEWEAGEWNESAAAELRVIEHIYKRTGNSAQAYRFLKAASQRSPFDMSLRGAVAAGASSVRDKIELYKAMVEDLEMWADGEKKEKMLCMVNHNLGLLHHMDLNDLATAAVYYERSIENDRESSSVVNLATIKRELGFALEARQLIAASIPPWTITKHQNLINTEFYVAPAGTDAVSSSKRMEELRAVTSALQRSIDAHLPAHHLKVTADCRAERERPLHVSFLSSNLVLHRAFLEPLLRDFDRERLHVEVWTKFSQVSSLGGKRVLNSILAIPDVTWHDMDGQGTEEIANSFLEAPTDILVEMGRHTAGNALLLVSQIKPAPIAVTWVGGAMATSGVSTMDAIICDAHHCPEGVGIERYFTERIYRMPHAYAPFAPDDHLGEIPIRDSPMVANGYVTFGSKNKFSKINAETVELWASILQRVPGARMHIQTMHFTLEAEKRVRGLFKDNKINMDRISFEGTLQKKQWLDSFNDIDIMLDTWPYCGGLTTLHALYMGTPVVTLCKESGPYWGCHSSAYVRTIMEDGSLVEKLSSKDYDSSQQWKWAATTERDYIQTAVALATKKGTHGKGGVRMAHQREAIRDALLASPIVTAQFTRDFEQVLSSIWQDLACPLEVA